MGREHGQAALDGVRCRQVSAACHRRGCERCMGEKTTSAEQQPHEQRLEAQELLQYRQGYDAGSCTLARHKALQLQKHLTLTPV